MPGDGDRRRTSGISLPHLRKRLHLLRQERQSHARTSFFAGVYNAIRIMDCIHHYKGWERFLFSPKYCHISSWRFVLFRIGRSAAAASGGFSIERSSYKAPPLELQLEFTASVLCQVLQFLQNREWQAIGVPRASGIVHAESAQSEMRFRINAFIGRSGTGRCQSTSRALYPGGKLLGKMVAHGVLIGFRFF
jgi:hypothetical protein